jgi:hypothetical protein
VVGVTAYCCDVAEYSLTVVAQRVGCDGVAHSGREVDACGACGGDGSACLGCDGKHLSGKVLDAAGNCSACEVGKYVTEDLRFDPTPQTINPKS